MDRAGMRCKWFVESGCSVRPQLTGKACVGAALRASGGISVFKALEAPLYHLVL